MAICWEVRWVEAVAIWRGHAGSEEAVWQGGYDFLTPLLEAR